MTENKISLEIPAADYQSIVAKLREVETAIAKYLIALTPDQRQSYPKTGDKTHQFVEKALEHAASNPELLPAYVDIAEWQKDSKTRHDLRTVLALCEKLRSNVDDTMLLCGSESYTAALAFYSSVKQAAKMNVAGAKTIVDDLSPRFPGKSGLSEKKAVA